MLEAEIETIIPLEEIGTALFITYDKANSITVNKDGIYQINYLTNLVSSSDVTITFSIQYDEVNIAGTQTFEKLQSNQLAKINSTVITDLQENDNLNLVIKSDKKTNITFMDGINSKISLFKIS